MRSLLPRRLAASVLLLGASALAACDSAGPEADTALVVSAVLGAGEPMPDIRLTRTVGLGEIYDPATAGVAGATVRVTREGGVPLLFSPTQTPGLYTPTTLVSVEPGATYRLDITVPGADPITATTVVPAAFSVVEAPPETITYQQPLTGPPLRITLGPPGPRQAVYVATTRALEADEFEAVTVDGEERFRSRNLPGRARPVPLIARFSGCEDDGAFLLCDDDPTDGGTGGTSPIINERSYILPGDGTAIVNVPWIGFGFYGLNEIGLISLDPALQDFVETQAVQGGGSTLSPGEIPNVTTNVQGGLGLFGSYARITVRTTILP